VNDVIEAVEGQVTLNACTGGKVDCALLPACGMTSFWQAAQKRLVEVFSQTTLADVQMGQRRAGNGLSIADSGTRLMMGKAASKGVL
jgi:DNA-binding IscR family transcriptional regulator